MFKDAEGIEAGVALLATVSYTPEGLHPNAGSGDSAAPCPGEEKAPLSGQYISEEDCFNPA